MNDKSKVNTPLVSVLIPVYNVERYVEKALQSVAQQTHDHLQVIVVDDCSTDGTLAIVEKFCAKDARFSVIRNDRNLHIVKSLNRAIAVARGDYFARCDGDDVMEVDRIERQLAYLKANPEIGLVGCSLKFIDERDTPINSYEFPSGAALTGKLLRYSTAVSHIWLAKRDVYDVVGGYRMPTVEDYDFLLRAHLAGFKLDNIPGYYGMHIRVRTDNTVGKYGVIQRKLFNYARTVHRAEKSGNTSFYSEAAVDEIIANGKRGILAKMHYLSDRVSYLASVRSKGVGKYLLIAGAALLSPYKFQYYLFATLRQEIIRRNKAMNLAALSK